MLMAGQITVDENLTCKITIAFLAEVGDIPEGTAGGHGIYAQATWQDMYEAAETLFEEYQIMRSKVGWIQVVGKDLAVFTWATESPFDERVRSRGEMSQIGVLGVL